MNPREADDLTADISKLERQISELKEEMYRDEQSLLRLQRRLDEGRDVLLRLRGHLDRLWSLKVTRHQGGPRVGSDRELTLDRSRVPMDSPGQFDSVDAHLESQPVHQARTATEADQGRTWSEGGTPPAPQVEETEASMSLKDAEMAEMVAFLARLKPEIKPIHGIRGRADGVAGEGFASAVRQVAHRSIARAGGPLDRNAIFRDLEASGVPLPSANARIKVSKILTRDPDLENRRGAGYSFTLRGLKRQLAELRVEFADSKGADLAASLWSRWDDVTDAPYQDASLRKMMGTVRLRGRRDSKGRASDP